MDIAKSSEFARRVMIAFVASLGTAVPVVGATLWTLIVQHEDTQNHLAGIDEKISYIKKDATDIRSEQIQVRKELGESHEKVTATESAIQTLAQDLVAGRNQTRPRITSLEDDSKRTGQDLAAIKQSLVDNREALADMRRALDTHSQDLETILQAVAPHRGRP